MSPSAISTRGARPLSTPSLCPVDRRVHKASDLIAPPREDVRKGEDLAAAVASRSTEQKRYADPKPECGAADGGHRRDGNEDGENGGGQPAGGTPAGSALRSQAPGDPALVAGAYHEVDD